MTKPFKPQVVNDGKQRKGIRVRYIICTWYWYPKQPVLNGCLVKQPFPKQRSGIIQLKQPSINRCFMFQVHIDNMIIILIYIYFYRSYLHAYPTFNLRAVTSFKIASLHLVIACRNALKEEVQNDSCIRVLVAMPFLLDFRLLPSSRTDTVGHFWAP